MLELAIRGGDVVAPHGTGRWNLGVKDGKIAFVGLNRQFEFTSLRQRVLISGGYPLNTPK